MQLNINNFNYTIMKNKTYIFGIACVLLITTGALFKIQHWSGAGIMITIGFCLFVLGFMPTALISSYRTETDKSLRKLYIIAYISVFIECMGTLFKIQHWPGAGIFLIVGIPLPFVLFLPAYILQIRKNKQLNYNNLLMVLFFFAYFAAITALLSLNISRNMIDEMILSANSLEQQSQHANTQTKALIASLPAKDSIKKELALKIDSKAESIYNLVDKMKVGIVKNVDDDNEHTIDKDDHINLWEVNGNDNKTIFYRDIFKSKAVELKNSLLAYKAFLITSLRSADQETIDFINHQLAISDDWQNERFDGKYLIGIIDELSAIKHNVSLSALEAVSTMAD